MMVATRYTRSGRKSRQTKTTAFERNQFAGAARWRLGELAQRVVTATVPHLSLEDVVDALWLPSTVKTLRAAYPIARDKDNVVESIGFGQWGLLNGGHDAKIEVEVKTERSGMLAPMKGLMANTDTLLHTPEGLLVHKAIRAAEQVSRDFGSVLFALRQLEKRMEEKQIGLSAIRYAAPWLPQLLPAQHPIQDFKGVLAPYFPLSPDVVEALRKAPDTLLGASFAPEDISPSDSWTLTFQYHPKMLDIELKML